MSQKLKMKEIRLEVVPTTHKKLKEIAKAEGGSIAVVVRRAINKMLEESAKESA